MAYSKGQLEALWAATNPGNGDPHLMAAIALAESSGNPSSLNSIGACGLWQIHPYEAGCLSPTINARMAGGKLKSQGLTAWEAYTNGAYKQYYTGVSGGATVDASLLSKGAEALDPFGLGLEAGKLGTEAGEGLSGNKIGLPSIFGSLGKLPGELTKIVELLLSPKGWIRIGKVLVGLFLLLAGVMGMANVNAPPVVQTGKKAAEVAVATGAV